MKEMDKLFRQVSVKDRLPEKDGMLICISQEGKPFITLHHVGFSLSSSAAYWLEEVYLPSEEELNKLKPLGDDSEVNIYDTGLYDGVNYILNKLKGTTK